MLNISDLGSNWYPGQSKVCTISKQVFTKTKKSIIKKLWHCHGGLEKVKTSLQSFLYHKLQGDNSYA